ncbi:hypothetical protein M3484_01975 [Pseudomonas sp. GX19020]|uniref:hypothetical protein n=1 Tax=Pseudomonas sp. GX19020 TaxID=2942277 RepID=UPI002018B68F|nr:hypothetical protein [Pseudomonas sp. GX19020]MCL4065344.1 hypothetical protein [Pseudomonas sp. GX19020]
MIEELKGARARRRYEREMIWWGAMLPYLKKPFPLEKFAGTDQSPKERAQAFHDAWGKIDRALERGRRA